MPAAPMLRLGRSKIESCPGFTSRFTTSTGCSPVLSLRVTVTVARTSLRFEMMTAKGPFWAA